MYAWIDTETGGLNPVLNPIFQVALVVTDRKFNIILEYASYVNVSEALPILSDDECKNYNLGLCISKKALEINGLHPSQERIRKAPSEFHVMSTLTLILDRYAGEICIAGYNVEYDQRMLSGAAERTNVRPKFTGSAYDTYSLARQRLRLPNFKLTSVCQYYGVPTEGAHDAMVDIKRTILVSKKMMGVAA